METVKEAIGPTIQRITKAGPHYQPPRTDRDTARPYARVIPWYEFLSKKRVIDDTQARIAESLDHDYHRATDLLFMVGAYGQSRWSGTTAGQEANQDLDPLDRRIIAVKRLESAKAELAPDEWRCIEHAIVHNAGLYEVGRAAGKKSKRMCEYYARRMISSALEKLATAWQLRARPA